MTLTELKYIVAVAREKHFGHAAEACFVSQPTLSVAIKKLEDELEIMRETEDGFRIAEEDLRLRGEGDVLGTRQSGVPGFRIARIETHGRLIGTARDDAQLHLSRDPTLSTERGEALRHLLYIFGRDEAIRLIRAG